MAPNIEPFGPVLHVGKGGYWDEDTQTYFFVDIYKHSIHSYKPTSNEFHSNVLGEFIYKGFIFKTTLSQQCYNIL